MLPTFRLILVAVGAVLGALFVALHGLVPHPDAVTRIGEVPSVGRQLVQLAIVQPPERSRRIAAVIQAPAATSAPAPVGETPAPAQPEPETAGARTEPAPPLPVVAADDRADSAGKPPPPSADPVGTLIRAVLPETPEPAPRAATVDTKPPGEQTDTPSSPAKLAMRMEAAAEAANATPSSPAATVKTAPDPAAAPADEPSADGVPGAASTGAGDGAAAKRDQLPVPASDDGSKRNTPAGSGEPPSDPRQHTAAASEPAAPAQAATDTHPAASATASKRRAARALLHKRQVARAAAKSSSAKSKPKQKPVVRRPKPSRAVTTAPAGSAAGTYQTVTPAAQTPEHPFTFNPFYVTPQPAAQPTTPARRSRPSSTR